jgi:hypothetical protein
MFLTYEDELEYLASVVEDTSDKRDWKNAVDKLGANIHYESLKKAFGCTRYSGYNVMQYYKNKQTKYLADDEIEKLEQIKDEIYKERVRLQDANREKRNVLREEARYENLVEVLKETMEFLPEIKLNQYKIEPNDTPNTAVLQLSDWHCGEQVDSQWNFYNIDEMKHRANVIKEKCINKCRLHKVNSLIIEINGDMAQGIINLSGIANAEEDVVQQIIIVSETLSQFINDLKPHFNNIKVITTLGNHGRLASKKSDVSTKENFEMLIPEFLRLRLQDVSIIKSNGLDFVEYEIDGKMICCAHGQNDKISDVIEDFSKIYKRVPTEVHLGHTHAYKDINDCDIMITVNGSLVGTDDFALTCRKVTKPAQNLIVYDTDRCIYSLLAE